jgi:hypothetical protein
VLGAKEGVTPFLEAGALAETAVEREAMAMTRRLGGVADNVYLVTGSTQGIGAAVALALARAKAKGVVICGRNRDVRSPPPAMRASADWTAWSTPPA